MLLVKEFRGAPFSTSWAISTILRSLAELNGCPKETAWKESGILLFVFVSYLERRLKDIQTRGALRCDRGRTSPRPHTGARRRTGK